MNFDEEINRIGTHSAKWDMMEPLYGVAPKEGLSMWVADMDFRPPQAVLDSLQGRIDHGVLGYFADDSAYKSALGNWLETRHDFKTNHAHMHQVHGLVQGVSIALQALTQKGDGIITFNPVYHAFGRTIRALDRDPVESKLVIENGQYMMDLPGLEASLKGHERLIILCSPHNPGGRVWTKEELIALGEFAKKHDLYIVSDEIHMDIVFGEKHHVFGNAFEGYDDRLIYLFSATKTFNIAGALTGTVYAPDTNLNSKIIAQLAAMGISTNLFGMLACTAAFEHGHKWCDAMVAYISENARIFNDGIAQIPGLSSMKLQSTYLAWVDFRSLGLSQDELEERVYKRAKIAANKGDTFGAGGEGFMRFNLATPRANVERAVKALQNAFADIQ